jgi:hypothetical protein
VKIALGAGNGEVHLFLDEKGRNELIECLKELEFPTPTSHEHFHLFTEEWGSHGLVVLNDATCEKLELEPVHHLKVYMRPPDKDAW